MQCIGLPPIDRPLFLGLLLGFSRLSNRACICETSAPAANRFHSSHATIQSILYNSSVLNRIYNFQLKRSCSAAAAIIMPLNRLRPTRGRQRSHQQSHGPHHSTCLHNRGAHKKPQAVQVAPTNAIEVLQSTIGRNNSWNNATSQLIWTSQQSAVGPSPANRFRTSTKQPPGRTIQVQSTKFNANRNLKQNDLAFKLHKRRTKGEKGGRSGQSQAHANNCPQADSNITATPSAQI